MTTDHYEINVALNGQHYFATAPRSLPFGEGRKATDVLADMRRRFPETEGFKVTMTVWRCHGHKVD